MDLEGILSTPPEGPDAFAGALHAIVRMFANSPPLAYKISLWILASIMGLLLLLSLGSISIPLFLRPDSRKRLLWVYRVVNTPRSTIPYIIPNGKLVTMVTIPISSLLGLILCFNSIFSPSIVNPVWYAAPVVPSWLIPWAIAFDAVVVIWMSGDTSAYAMLGHPILVNILGWAVPFGMVVSSISVTAYFGSWSSRLRAEMRPWGALAVELSSLPKAEAYGRSEELWQLIQHTLPSVRSYRDAFHAWCICLAGWSLMATLVFGVSLGMLLLVLMRQIDNARHWANRNLPANKPIRQDSAPHRTSTQPTQAELGLKSKLRHLLLTLVLVAAIMAFISGGLLWGIHHIDDVLVQEKRMRTLMVAIQWPVLLGYAVLSIKDFLSTYDSAFRWDSGVEASPTRAINSASLRDNIAPLLRAIRLPAVSLQPRSRRANNHATAGTISAMQTLPRRHDFGMDLPLDQHPWVVSFPPQDVPRDIRPEKTF